MKRKTVCLFLLAILILAFSGVAEARNPISCQEVREILTAIKSKKTNNIAFFMIEKRVGAKAAASYWDGDKKCWKVILGRLKSLEGLPGSASISCDEEDIFLVSSIDEAANLIKNYFTKGTGVKYLA